jgi:hypothetical protein
LTTARCSFFSIFENQPILQWRISKRGFIAHSILTKFCIWIWNNLYNTEIWSKLRKFIFLWQGCCLYLPSYLPSCALIDCLV